MIKKTKTNSTNARGAFFAYLLIVPLMFCSCSRTEDVKPISEVSIHPKTLQVVNADNQFGFEIFKLINTNVEADQNVFISPTSISIALAMAYNGANGATQTAMADVLNKSGLSSTEINETYKALINDLVMADQDVKLAIANSVWYRNTVAIEQEFISANENYYDALVSPLDFSDPLSVNIINNWVANNTNNKIDKIIDGISPTDIMYLINAIYFKGTWKYEFDPVLSSDMQFHPTNGSSYLTSFMQQKADIKSIDNEQVQGIELPYGEGDYSMVILLPQEGNNIEDLSASFTLENWMEWQSQFQLVNEMNIFIPKFKFEFKKHLVPELDDMGMGIAFTDQADFSGISSSLNLVITDVLHKTYVEVNEEGTEAAAVTSITFGTTSAGPSNTFLANRPFLFIIKENTTNALVFIGKLNKPE